MIKNYQNKRLKRRSLIEKIFKLSSLMAVVFAISMLVILLFSIFSKGYTAFFTHYITVNVSFDEKYLFDDFNKDYPEDAYIEEAIIQSFKKSIISPNDLQEFENLSFEEIFSTYSVFDIKNEFTNNYENLINKNKEYKLLVSSNIDMLLKGYLASGSIIDDKVINLFEKLKAQKLIDTKFNSIFFENADSRYPELAGIKGAFFGSLYTIILVVIFSIIISVGAAIYLEEFAKRGRLVNFIEVNINNLAAVPSIIFGLLGLIVFEQFLQIPRATPLLAAFVLTLMTLPTVIITSRISLSAVPLSIREGAFALGSSKIQVIIFHLLPMSFSGILTGMIISIARVIGESAPLLMIGMVAYISSVPDSMLAKATVFPVQILLWSDAPELGYIEKASAASMILLIFLMLINWVSIYLRNKFEVKL